MLIVKVKELEDLFEERVGDSRGMMLAFQGYESSLETFFLKMSEKAMQRGVCIQDKLANPTAEQIAYFQEQLGECTEPFEVSYAYVRHQCKKWLTFLSDTQAHVLSCAIHETLKRLQRMGKNESVLKNAYMKFMCWWYYHFRKCLSSIGLRPFYVLYEGSLTAYEAYMLTCVALCGGRVGIVDYDKTAEKWKDMQEIQVYCPVVGQVLQPFPNREMIKGWKASVIATSKVQSMFGQRPSLHPCVNTWLQDVSMESIKDMQRSQKADQMDSFYMRVDGCADRNTYANELFQLWQDKKAQGPVLVYEGDVPVLQTSEVSWVQRPVQLEDLSIGTVIASNMSDFTGALRNYCCHLLWDMSQQDEGQIGLKMNKTVMRLGILRRYQQLIKEKGALFVFETEPLHAWSWQVFELLVRCGVDVLVCNPNKVPESYTSDVLLIKTEEEVCAMQTFPKERSQATLSTTAYNAERDLDTMLYQDTGMYRDYQYKKAEPIVVRTMFEEIEQWWKEPVSVRQGFETNAEHVVIPVVYAKVLGVKDGDKRAYQKMIDRLLRENENVYVLQGHVPLEQVQIGGSRSSFGTSGSFGQMITSMSGLGQEIRDERVTRYNIAEVLTNRKVDVQKVRQHEAFRFGYLQDATITFMVDRLDALLWSGIIEGVGQRGQENKLLEVFFGLPKEVIQMIQRWDFTKVNPKLVYVNTSEQVMSLEDSMFVQYLSMLGFDVVMFIPTGYNIVDGHFRKRMYTEHQLGEYVYDMRVSVKRKRGLFG